MSVFAHQKRPGSHHIYLGNIQINVKAVCCACHLVKQSHALLTPTMQGSPLVRVTGKAHDKTHRA